MPPPPAVGGLGDGGDLLLAFLEGSFGGVGFGRGLAGSRGRLSQGDVRLVEVFAGDLGVLRRGCGAGADLGELDLDLGDAHLRGLFGSLGGCDLFLRGGGLRHLGQHEEGAGGDCRQAQCGWFRVVSSSSHLRCVDRCAGGRVLGKSLSTFVTLGNKRTTKPNFHTCNNRNISNINTMITAQLPALTTPLSTITMSLLTHAEHPRPGRHTSPPSGTIAPRPRR